MKLVYENLEKNLYYAVRMLRFMKPLKYSKYYYKILFKGLHPLFALCNRERGMGGGGVTGGDKQRLPKSGRQWAWQAFVELFNVKKTRKQRAGKSSTEQI